MTDSDITLFGSERGDAPVNGSDNFEHLGGAYDFEIYGLIPGTSARIVIPLRRAIPQDARYRFALNSGFTAPIQSLGAKIGGKEFDTEMRDATFVSLTAELNKWLTNAINLTTGIGLNAQESKSEVFDTSDARIFVNSDTNFSKKDLVYTTFSFITGDTVSSSSPTLDIINAADGIEPDDAFGGVEANQSAYRIDADTVVLTVGYNCILTRDLSIDLSARYIESEAKDDDDIYYERTILRASLLGRF